MDFLAINIVEVKLYNNNNNKIIIIIIIIQFYSTIYNTSMLSQVILNE